MVNEHQRISMTDSPLSAIIKLSEGNPGAMSICTQLFQTGPQIDPDAGPIAPIVALMDLDALGIYGSRIWILYKDVCQESIPYTHAALRAWQLGLITDPMMITDPEGIFADVQQALPKFGKSISAL